MLWTVGGLRDGVEVAASSPLRHLALQLSVLASRVVVCRIPSKLFRLATFNRAFECTVLYVQNTVAMNVSLLGLYFSCFPRLFHVYR